MYKTTITSQGTISIPAVLRKKYGLIPGEKLVIEDTGKIVVSKAPDFADLRKMNQGIIKTFVPYKAGDGFSAHVAEKYGKK
jgi:AbrB family looped-hinge helix DNA binding protein